MILISTSFANIIFVISNDNVKWLNWLIVFGQIPYPVVSVTKDGSMGLLIKL